MNFTAPDIVAPKEGKGRRQLLTPPHSRAKPLPRSKERLRDSGMVSYNIFYYILLWEVVNTGHSTITFARRGIVYAA